MTYEHSIHVIDTHTVGQNTRIVIGGLPLLRGDTMMEKKEYFMRHYDNIRRFLMHEPRGHADMFGAILTEPTLPTADYGVLFLDGQGSLNMCGHGTIGVATVLVEQGMVEVKEPYTHLVLEMPAGLIEVNVKVESGRALEVSFQNVPSFLYKKDVKVSVDGFDEIVLDIAFGGSFFGIVHKDQLDIDEINPKNISSIISKALLLMKAINEQIPIQHPTLNINKVELIEIYGPSQTVGVDAQNVVILGHGEVDRSPCGTGTCAKVASLVARGELSLGETFVYESILKTQFKAKAIRNVQIGEFTGIIPEITGHANITGFNHLIATQDDELKHGFIL